MTEERIFPDLPCGMNGCKDPARQVAVQTNDLAMLFASMAGVLCDDHAAVIRELGAVTLSFSGFGNAARAEAKA